MRRLLPFLFFVFASYVFAEDYGWSRYVAGPFHPTVAESCAYNFNLSAQNNGNYKTGPALKVSDTDYLCRYYNVSNGNLAGNSIHTYWRGSCPSGLTFNPTTGQCEGDPCAPKNGQSQRFQKSSASGDTYGTIGSINGKPIFSPATSACFSGCAVSTADQKCVARVNGAYVCRGTAYYTGVSCTTGQAAPSPVEATTAADPAPANLKTDLPCKYVSNPDGTQSCTSITAKESEGLQCGTVNGQQTCVAKDPSKDETKIDTTVSSVTNPDGSITTTKTDTQTKTSCPSYAPSCTSTSTTTTTTTTKNAEGELIASDETCTGTNCSSSGNPDSDGDGFGDCTGDNCGEGEDGKPSNKPTMPKLDGAPSYADSLNSFQQKIKAAPIYAAVGGLSVPSGGACSFGSAQTFFGAISFDDFCAIAPQILNPLRYLFLAIWAWAAIRLFFTA